jgi:tRNA(Ile)-lysidine synthase
MRGAGRIELPDGWTVSRRGGALSVGPERVEAAARPFRVRVRVPGETRIPGAGLRIAARVGPGLVKDRPTVPGRLPARASLSAAAVGRKALIARSWRAGDRMRPLGLGHAKKLQDIFVDGKTPREQRARVPVFECGGEIVWVPGYRIAAGWEVLDAAQPSVTLRVEGRQCRRLPPPVRRTRIIPPSPWPCRSWRCSKA